MAAFVDAMAEVRAPATVRRYCGEHRRRAPSHRPPREREEHQGPARAQAHAPQEGAPPGAGAGPDLAAAGERLIDARNRALVAVAYDALLRRSELTALAVEDVSEEVDGSAALLVRRGKGDPGGRGAVVYLAPDTVVLLRIWRARAGAREGRLFRSVTKSGRVGSSLHASQIPRIFKAMAHAAGLPLEVADALSGHSARIGAAQDMIASGIGLPAVLQAGCWKSPTMVNRYGERLLARESGAAQFAKLQERA